MPKKPPQPAKKPMTLDRLAASIRDDFASVRGDIQQLRQATKDDIRQVRAEMATKQDIADLRADVKMITDVMVSKADLTEAIHEEISKTEYVREIDELRDRMHHVEEKLGIKHGRRAA